MPFIDGANQVIVTVPRTDIDFYIRAANTLATQGMHFYLVRMQPEVPVYKVNGTRIYPAQGHVFVKISSDTTSFEPFWEEVRRIKDQSK